MSSRNRAPRPHSLYLKRAGSKSWQKNTPYSFLLYLDFLEDVENYLNEADRYKRLIDKAKAAILRNNGERDEAEKRFRLVNDLLSRVSGTT